MFVLDCETVGLPRNWKAPYTDIANWPEPTSLALLDDRDGLPLTTVWHLTHEAELTPEARAVQHYDETVTRHAMRDVVPLLPLTVHGVVVAHNANFDRNIVGAAFMRSGFGVRWSGLALQWHDTMTSLTNVVKRPNPRGGWKWPSLSECAIFYGLADRVGQHEAGTDVALTYAVFQEQLRHHPETVATQIRASVMEPIPTRRTG